MGSSVIVVMDRLPKNNEQRPWMFVSISKVDDDHDRKFMRRELLTTSDENGDSADTEYVSRGVSAVPMWQMCQRFCINETFDQPDKPPVSP